MGFVQTWNPQTPSGTVKRTGEFNRVYAVFFSVLSGVYTHYIYNSNISPSIFGWDFSSHG